MNLPRDRDGCGDPTYLTAVHEGRRVAHRGGHLPPCTTVIDPCEEPVILSRGTAPNVPISTLRRLPLERTLIFMYITRLHARVSSASLFEPLGNADA